MGKGWKIAKQAFLAVEDAIVAAGTGPDHAVYVNDGTCQMKGRRGGNQKCGRELKKNHNTCGAAVCEKAFWAEYKGHAPRTDGKKGLLKDNPQRLENRRGGGSGIGYNTSMRKQVWDEDKGKWVYPKPE